MTQKNQEPDREGWATPSEAMVDPVWLARLDAERAALDAEEDLRTRMCALDAFSRTADVFISMTDNDQRKLLRAEQVTHAFENYLRTGTMADPEDKETSA